MSKYLEALGFLKPAFGTFEYNKWKQVHDYIESLETADGGEALEAFRGLISGEYHYLADEEMLNVDIVENYILKSQQFKAKVKRYITLGELYISEYPIDERRAIEKEYRTLEKELMSDEYESEAQDD